MRKAKAGFSLLKPWSLPAGGLSIAMGKRGEVKRTVGLFDVVTPTDSGGGAVEGDLRRNNFRPANREEIRAFLFQHRDFLNRNLHPEKAIISVHKDARCLEPDYTYFASIRNEVGGRGSYFAIVGVLMIHTKAVILGVVPNRRQKK